MQNHARAVAATIMQKGAAFEKVVSAKSNAGSPTGGLFTGPLANRPYLAERVLVSSAWWTTSLRRSELSRVSALDIGAELVFTSPQNSRSKQWKEDIVQGNPAEGKFVAYYCREYISRTAPIERECQCRSCQFTDSHRRRQCFALMQWMMRSLQSPQWDETHCQAMSANL